MTDAIRRIHTETVLLCDEQGPLLRSEQDALDLVGQAAFPGAEQEPASWVVIPVARLADTFFRLSTGVAGAIVQKLGQYRLGVAVIGDVSSHTAASSAFHDFVVESNRGRQLWFPSTLEEFEDRLARLRSSRPAT